MICIKDECTNFDKGDDYENRVDEKIYESGYEYIA